MGLNTKFYLDDDKFLQCADDDLFLSGETIIYGTIDSVSGYQVCGSGTTINVDVSNNLILSDIVTGTKTLAELAAGSSAQGITGATNGLTAVGDDVILGGTLTGNTDIDLNTNYLNFNNIDSSFNVGSGFNQLVNYITLQSDNKILVGGYFSTYNGITRNGIARLNTNGTIDTSFVIGTGFNLYAYVIKVQSDDKILVGGNFSTYSGASYNKIIRLNTDGTIDTSFVIGTGFNDDVRAIKIQSDNKIVIAGQFTTYSGVTYNELIRLNPNGSIDTSFTIGTGFNLEIYDIDIQSDGKIIVGGYFTTYDGSSYSRIIRLNSDGSLDTSFIIGTGFNGDVYTTELQSDGKILIGGTFTTYSGVTSNRIIRLNSDGSIDDTFSISTGFGGSVYDIQLQSDDKILVGGTFISYSGTTYNRIIRLNSDGSVDSVFDMGIGFNNSTYSLKIQPDNKILVGGNFTTYSGASYTRIIKLSSDGTIDNGGDTISEVSFKEIGIEYGADYSGNFTNRTLVDKAYVDAEINNIDIITTLSGLTDTTIVSPNNDEHLIYSGDTWVNSAVSFDSGITGATNGLTAVGSDVILGGTLTGYTNIVISGSSGFEVNDTAYDNDFYVTSNGVGMSHLGGAFGITGVVGSEIVSMGTDDVYLQLKTGVASDLSFASGFTITDNGSEEGLTYAADYSGTFVDRSLVDKAYVDGSVTGSGITGATNGLTVIGDDVILGGTLTGNTDIRLDDKYFKFFNTGSTGLDTGSGFNNLIYSIEIQSDDKILIGGSFTTYTGSSYNNIIRLNSNGTVDPSFDMGTGFGSSIVYDIKQQSDGKILVGGTFTTYTGTTYNRIIRLNSDGSVDSAFDIGTGFSDRVDDIAIQSDSKILVVGAFTGYTGTTYNRIIRLNSNGSVDTTFDIGTGFNNLVFTTTIQSDNKILVGGGFTTYTGTTYNRIIRLNSDGSVDSTFNMGTGFDSFVYDIKMQSDGKILVGGLFTSYDGNSYNRIIRLNSDGSVDSAFDIGTGFNTTVYDIEIRSDNKILIGGGFTTYTGTTYNRIIRLNSNGSVDTTFDIGTGFDNEVRDIELPSNGELLVGGWFTTFKGETNNKIIGLNPNADDVTLEVFFNDKGLEYGNDYSSNFTDRTLVDKAYVDNTTFSNLTENQVLYRGVSGIEGSDNLVWYNDSARFTIDGLVRSVIATESNYDITNEIRIKNGYDIASGIVDSGYRMGININSHISDPNFLGTLGGQYAMRIQHGHYTGAGTGTLTNSYGIYLQGLDSGSATITNKYGIFQSGSNFNNFFSGQIRSDNEFPIALTNIAPQILFEGTTLETALSIISRNDGAGNFNIRTTNYFETTEKYTETGDGATHIEMGSDNSSGKIRLEVAATGTAGATVTWAKYFELNTTNIDTNAVISSTVATGTAPFTVASTTKVTNLNADLLDGIDSVYFRGQNYGSTTQDPNDATYPYILTNHANSPNASYYWHIRTQFYSTISSTGNRSQIAIQYNTSISAYVRQCYSTTWTAWLRIDNNGKAADSNLLDGIDSLSFVRSNATDSISGAITHTGNYYRFNDNIELYFGTSTSQSYIYSDGANSRWRLTSGNLYIMDNATNRFTFARTTGILTATRYTSTQATGTAPFTVASTTTVTNLSADRLDGISSASFLRSDALDYKTSGNLVFNDNVYLEFGTGADVEFFYNGTDFYTDVINGTDNWYMRAVSTTRFTFAFSTGDITAHDFKLSSDRRLKTNITPLEKGIDGLQPVSFTFNDIENGGINYGFIAQDMLKTHPELVTGTGKDNDDNGEIDYYAIKQNSIIALLVKEVQDMKSDNLKLITRVTELENKNSSLEDRLEKLEKLLLK